MHSDITGIILSGGKSLRMGENKSFLKIGGITLIERITDLMKSVFENVILISNTSEEYKYLNIPVYEDVYKGKGPLAGIHSGLVNSRTQKNFITACDIPLLTKDVIEFIINYESDKLAVVPKANGFVQQLCGLYSKGCLMEIENILMNVYTEGRDAEQKKRKCSVLSLIEKVDGKIIDMESQYPEYSEYIFMNVNTPEDYEFLKCKMIS